MVKGLTDALYRDLSAPQRRKVTASDPFDCDKGALGDGFTMLAMLQTTDEERWRDLLDEQIKGLAQVIRTRRIDHVGLTDGLTGLWMLLTMSEGYVRPRPGLVEAVSHQVNRLVDEGIHQIRTNGGENRGDFGVGTGLAGVALQLLRSGRDERMADRICDLFLDLSSLEFPRGFWTPASGLRPEEIEERPELSFGGRDLGYGMGLAGVLSLLREKAQRSSCPRYQAAAVTIVRTIVEDVIAHGGRGISGYQTPPPVAGRPGVSTRAPQTWSRGLPGVEFAVAGNAALTAELYSVVSYGEDYVDPTVGGFDVPGLRNGVAGRLLLADQAGLHEDPRWEELLVERLTDYVARSEAGELTDVGFWAGVGGAAAVWSGRSTSRGYAPVLTALAVNGSCGAFAV
ncbi:MAG TPA: hypothetical protein H9870_06405 [Candidatus Corynebacterium avicola]|uniref:Lanthionine synthetase C-like protein n=1 Tax=Candidatus Corynebacterium avicola TaxID=2838527 RepID=A0A9D1ULY7_9CORY|nr:hypothetical protein [Candidatus Corynebacterium avicola]